MLKVDNLDETVHRRIMQLYHLTGRHYAAIRQYESCRKLLAKELGVAPEEETERLYTAILRRRKVPAHEPEQTTRELIDDLIPSSLPGYLAPFVGREREIAEVVDLIQRPDVRILTLTGAGGTGKTRLAVRAASQVRGCFENGVFFVDLSALKRPAQVVPAIAGSMDLRATRGQSRSLLEILKHSLRDKRLLMLLDTFEHLREAAFAVQEILDACPGCKALVTSREVLPISG